MMELVTSGWDMWPDVRFVIDEVLACDEWVIAHRGRYVGHGEDGGAAEIPVGYVIVVDDGRIVRQEMFDPDDREAILARFAELGGRCRGGAR